MNFPDTDSFIHEFTVEDIYEEMRKIKHILDLSNYPKNHILYDDRNIKKLGFLKCETEGKLIKEFVGLKAKLYSLKYLDGTTIKKAKGLQKVVLKNHIKHENYLEVLENDIIISAENRRIQSRFFNLHTVKSVKITHTSFDDKRFICQNKIDTKPHGFYDI